MPVNKASAQDQPATESPSEENASLLDQVVEFELKNGMRWLFLQRGDAPVFTGVVYVKAGGIDEPPGKAGIAHMFEHMAFKGTTEIGPSDYQAERKLLDRVREIDAEIAALSAEQSAQREALIAERTRAEDEAREHVNSNALWNLLQENGADVVNAATSKDETWYYASMPSHRLGLWSFLASEMVFHPVMREFYSERDVVMEERRQRTDNKPTGRLYEKFMKTAFTVSPYQDLIIGSMDSLQNLTIADAEDFHTRYYVPENMIGTIVGNFEIDDAKRYVQRFFGRIAAGPGHEAPVFPSEPPQTEERRVEMTADANPMMFVGYHKPTLPHRDDYVFDALQFVLCHGDSARLRKALVHEQRLVQDISCSPGVPAARLDHLFFIGAAPMAGVSFDAVLAAIEVVLDEVRTELVDESELRKALTNLSAGSVWEMNRNADLANSLARSEGIAGTWRYIAEHKAVMQTITREEIRDVVRRYLNPEQRTIGTLRREK